MKEAPETNTPSLNELIERDDMGAIIDKLQESEELIETYAPDLGDYFAEKIRRKQWDICSGTFEGWTLLHVTAYFGFPKHVKLLIETGADLHREVSQGEWEGLHPLDVAILQQQSAVLRRLLEYGADINHVIQEGPHEGKTPLYLAIMEVEDGDDVVNVLCDRGADTNAVINYALKKGWPQGDVLGLAARLGNEALVNYFLSKNVHVNHAMTQKTNTGFTPLCMAIRGGDKNMKVVTRLIEAGADIRSPLSEGPFKNYTPLDIAALSGARDIGQVLIEKGASIDIPESLISDEAKDHFAFVAAIFGNKALLQKLVEQYQAPLDHTLDRGRLKGSTVLVAAVESGDLKVVKYLVEDKGVKVAQQFQGGTGIVISPLIIAAIKGHWSIVKLLLDQLEKQAQEEQDLESHLSLPVYNDDPQGYTLLQMAVIARQTEIALQLVNLGVDILPDNKRTEETPLMMASSYHSRCNDKTTQVRKNLVKKDFNFAKILISERCNHLDREAILSQSNLKVDKFRAEIRYWGKVYREFKNAFDEKIQVTEALVNAYGCLLEKADEVTGKDVDCMRKWFDKWAECILTFDDKSEKQALLDKANLAEKALNQANASSSQVDVPFSDAKNYFLSMLYLYKGLAYRLLSKDVDGLQCQKPIDQYFKRLSSEGREKYKREPTPPKLREFRGKFLNRDKRRPAKKRRPEPAIEAVTRPAMATKAVQLDAIQQFKDYLGKLTEGHCRHASSDGQDCFEFEVPATPSQRKHAPIVDFWESFKRKEKATRPARSRKPQKKKKTADIELHHSRQIDPRSNKRDPHWKAIVIPKTKACHQRLQRILKAVKDEMAVKHAPNTADSYLTSSPTLSHVQWTDQFDALKTHLTMITWGGDIRWENERFVLDYSRVYENDNNTYQLEVKAPEAKQKVPAQIIPCPPDFIHKQVVTRLKKLGFQASLDGHQLTAIPKSEVSLRDFGYHVRRMVHKLQDYRHAHDTKPSSVSPARETATVTSPAIKRTHEPIDVSNQPVELNDGIIQQWLENLCPRAYNTIQFGALRYTPFFNKKKQKLDTKRNQNKVRIRIKRSEAPVVGLVDSSVDSASFLKGLYNALIDYFEKRSQAIQCYADREKSDLIIPRALFEKLDEPDEAHQFQQFWLVELTRLDQPRRHSQTHPSKQPVFYQKYSQTFFNTPDAVSPSQEAVSTSTTPIDMKQVLSHLKKNQTLLDVVDTHLKRLNTLLQKDSQEDLDTQKCLSLHVFRIVHMLSRVPGQGESNPELWKVRNLFRHASQKIDVTDAARRIADVLNVALVPRLADKTITDYAQKLSGAFQSLLTYYEPLMTQEPIQNRERAKELIQAQIQCLKEPNLSDEARVMCFVEIGKIVSQTHASTKLSFESLAQAFDGGEKQSEQLLRACNQLYRQLGHEPGRSPYQFKNIYVRDYAEAQQAFNQLSDVDTPDLSNANTP